MVTAVDAATAKAPIESAIKTVSEGDYSYQDITTIVGSTNADVFTVGKFYNACLIEYSSNIDKSNLYEDYYFKADTARTLAAFSSSYNGYLSFAVTALNTNSSGGAKEESADYTFVNGIITAKSGAPFTTGTLYKVRVLCEELRGHYQLYDIYCPASSNTVLDAKRFGVYGWQNDGTAYRDIKVINVDTSDVLLKSDFFEF